MALFRRAGVAVIGERRTLHRVVKQAVAECTEMDVARDIIFAQR